MEAGLSLVVGVGRKADVLELVVVLLVVAAVVGRCWTPWKVLGKVWRPKSSP